MQNFKQKNIISLWFSWHFFEAPRSLLSIWRNFFSFGLDFFSIPILIMTLFSPWRKYKWNYPRGFDPRGYLETFISNMFSRLIGAVCRLFLVITGVVVEVLVLVIGAITILIWMAMPLILILLITLVFLT